MSLKEWLNSIGKTPEWLADELGVTAKTVRCWIRGEYLPRGRRLSQIVDLSKGKVSAMAVLTRPSPSRPYTRRAS